MESAREPQHHAGGDPDPHRQATSFGDTFSWAAIGVLAFLVLVGLLTQVRVVNAMTEDLMDVVAMNRLRGAYVDPDPGIEQYFMASVNDDEAGIDKTYYFFGNRDVTQVIGSSGMFIVAVNSVLAALLIGFLTLLTGASTGVAIVVGAVIFVMVLLASMSLGGLAYRHVRARISPLRPTSE